jgi:hypothetical protein
MPTLAKLNGTGPSDQAHDGLKPSAFARRPDLRLILIIGLEELKAGPGELAQVPAEQRLQGPDRLQIPSLGRPRQTNCRRRRFQPIVEPIACVSAVNALFFSLVFGED